jgi:hypothetical protein
MFDTILGGIKPSSLTPLQSAIIAFAGITAIAVSSKRFRGSVPRPLKQASDQAALKAGQLVKAANSQANIVAKIGLLSAAVATLSAVSFKDTRANRLLIRARQLLSSELDAAQNAGLTKGAQLNNLKSL